MGAFFAREIQDSRAETPQITQITQIKGQKNLCNLWGQRPLELEPGCYRPNLQQTGFI